MIRLGRSQRRRAGFAAAVVLTFGVPLLAQAQAPAAPETAAVADSAAMTPGASAVHDSIAKHGTPLVKAPMPAALSDTARAALRAQVERELGAMADSLKLTSAQRSKARPIMLDHAYQLRGLRTKYSTAPRTPETREAMAKDMQTIREATDAKLAEIMSGEQMAKYKQMREEMLTRARSKMSTPDTTGGAKK